MPRATDRLATVPTALLLLASVLLVSGAAAALGVGPAGGLADDGAQYENETADDVAVESGAVGQSLFATAEERTMFLANPTDGEVNVTVASADHAAANATHYAAADADDAAADVNESVTLAADEQTTLTVAAGTYHVHAETADEEAVAVNGLANWTVTLAGEHPPLNVSVEDRTATVENLGDVAALATFHHDDGEVTPVVVPANATVTEELDADYHDVRAQVLDGQPLRVDVDAEAPPTEAPPEDDEERDGEDRDDGPPERAEQPGMDDGAPPADGDFDCDDFDSWEEANEVYEAAPGEHGLDADDDGIPCESLRGAPDGDGSDDEQDDDAAAPAEFELSNLDPADATVTQGDAIDVSVGVENVGEEAGEQTLALTIGDEVEIAGEVELDAGESDTVTFETVGTGALAPGEYEHVVSSEADQVSGTLTIEAEDGEPAEFDLSELEPESATVTQGEEIDVSTAVENVGDANGTQSVELILNGDALDSQSIELDAGEEQVVTFENVSTAELDPGEYEHGVRTEDDEVTGTLTVESENVGNGDYECNDFDTWDEANEVFESTEDDEYGLDADDDGVPCESFPGAPDA